MLRLTGSFNYDCKTTCQPQTEEPLPSMSYQITFPNQETISLPTETVRAILASSAKYAQPLWQQRDERVLKLGGHQWISPSNPATAYLLLAEYPTGVVAAAWKLFNRDWLRAAESYFDDSTRYPNHPRQWGRNVVPLVDEDNGSQQIGWVRIHQQTQADENHAVFVQFMLLELFAPRALPVEYA